LGENVSITDVYITRWEPSDRPIHCANCSQARVYGDPSEPFARCNAGHGKGTYLARLIRPKPHGWRAAVRCDDFEAAG
jgi:hypothetical protein